MDPEKQLQDLMQARGVPQMRSNLAERIIEAAEREKSKGRCAPQAWWIAFSEAFLLPKPAYVMALLLVLGIAMGLSFDLSTTVEGETVSSFIYTAETVTEGDWL